MKPVSIDALYTAFTPAVGDTPPDRRRELGQFEVFTVGGRAHQPPAHFNRQAFYKISLNQGCGQLEFAGQSVAAGPRFLFLATPSLSYRWAPQAAIPHTGCFCIFTDEFLQPARGGVLVRELPIFQPGAQLVIALTEAEYQALESILQKMQHELAASYAYKYDLLRTYLVELIHAVQKLQPAVTAARRRPASRAVCRVARAPVCATRAGRPAAPAHGPRLRRRAGRARRAPQSGT